MVFLCCGISCFLFHRVVDFAVLTLFLDQASPHWLTFSFPSTNDSCMYLPVCVMMVKLFTILCHIGLCFFFFFFVIHTLQLVGSVLYTGCWVMHLEGHRSQPSPVLTSVRCHYVFSHSYCPWVEYFLCLCEVLCQFLNVLSPNTTPRWLSWVGAGGRWTCAVCHLSSCQQMVNTGTLTISLLSEAWLLLMSRRQLEGWTQPVLGFSSTGGS